MSFIGPMGVMVLGFVYVGWRIVGPARSSFPLNVVLGSVLLGLFGVLLAAVYATFNRPSGTVNETLTWSGYLIMGFFSIVFLFLIFRDSIWLITFVIQKTIALMRYLFGQESESIKPVISERRYFLHNAMNLGTIGIAATITGCGFIAARRYPKTVDVSVPLKNLPQDLVGLKIVQISDLHVGSTIKRDYVSEVVKRVNGLDPDIVVLTGDLADGSVSWLGKDVSPLGALRSRFGNYFVTGNHEYYSGVGPWLKEVQRLGFEVLLNEHRVIRKGAGRLVLAGVTDFNAGRMMGSHASNPAASLNNSPDCDLKVLLAHQPRSLFEAARAGFDLQISGHTHGGQYFPVNLLARLANPYLAGLHKHGDTWIYVNRGTGYWGPPMRTGSISEITSLTLISA